MSDETTKRDNLCGGCGRVLNARRNAYNWSTRRFCSEECKEHFLTTSTRDRCPECDGDLYTKGEVRAKGRPKRFCSSECKTAFNTRRERRALQLYDLTMGRRYDTDDPLHHALDTTIRRLRDQWHRDDSPKHRPRKKTWYGWHHLVPNDLLAQPAAAPPSTRPDDPDREAHLEEVRAMKAALAIRTSELIDQPVPLERQGPPRPLAMSQSPSIVVQKRKRDS